MKCRRLLLTSLFALCLLVMLPLASMYVRGKIDSAASTTLSLAGWPSAVTLDGATARAFVAVHNSAMGRIVTVDTHTGHVLRTTDVGARPLAVDLASRAHRVIVLSLTSLYALDATSGALLRAIPVTAYPNALAVDESRGRVLVTSHTATGTSVTIYDTASFARLAHFTLAARSAPIAVAAAGGRALVVTTGGRTSLIDETTARVVRVTPVGQGAGPVAIDSLTDRGFVANPVSDTVRVIDLATGGVLRTVGVGLVPSWLGVDEAAGRVLVVNHGDGTLTLLDARSGAVLRTVALGSYPWGLALDTQDDLAATTTNTGVSIVDAATGALLRRIPVRSGAAVVAVGGRPTIAIIGLATVPVLQVLTPGTLVRHAPISAGPSAARSLAVVQAFVDAYNRHDAQGVLATLAPDVSYGDCAYTDTGAVSTGSGARDGMLHGWGAVLAWLQARFAEHDRFLQPTISLPGGQKDPLGASLEAIRVNDAVQEHQPITLAGAKIALTQDGGHLQWVAMGGGANCSLTRNQ